MLNPLIATDPTLEAVAIKLTDSGVDTALMLAKVLSIMGSMTPWDGDTVQALMDDVLVDVVATANLPAPDSDEDETMRFWSDVGGVDYGPTPNPWDPM